MPYDPIEQEIVDALDALAPYGYERPWRLTQWTLGVLGLIGAIGWRRGYTFCATTKLQEEQAFIIQVLNDIQAKLKRTLYDPERDRFIGPQYSGGWLYDLTWLRYNLDYQNIHLINPDDYNKGNNPIYNRVALLEAPLVMESEWRSFGHVKEDFEKLLLARSKYRIMVFSVTDRNQFSQYINQLTGFIRQYKSSQPGDRYLFCGTDEAQHQFLFNQFIVP